MVRIASKGLGRRGWSHRPRTGLGNSVAVPRRRTGGAGITGTASPVRLQGARGGQRGLALGERASPCDGRLRPASASATTPTTPGPGPAAARHAPSSGHQTGWYGRSCRLRGAATSRPWSRPRGGRVAGAGSAGGAPPVGHRRRRVRRLRLGRGSDGPRPGTTAPPPSPRRLAPRPAGCGAAAARAGSEVVASEWAPRTGGRGGGCGRASAGRGVGARRAGVATASAACPAGRAGRRRGRRVTTTVGSPRARRAPEYVCAARRPLRRVCLRPASRVGGTAAGLRADRAAARLTRPGG